MNAFLQAIGLESVIEGSAIEHLGHIRELLGSDAAYVNRIWRLRCPGGTRKSTGAWPYKRGEEIPAANVTPMRRARKP